MVETVETVIVGGGQAGLATSYHLRRRGREHVVLEQAAQAGSAWRDGRWDSFTLVTPNWTFRLPGAEYDGDAPGGFMPRDEIVATFERYVDRFELPVQYETRVISVERDERAGGYLVATEHASFGARNVVVATGLFQRPRTPSFAADLSDGITQLHSSQYRSPGSTPEGAVLVVGSAQSGCQIAEELYRNGRRVYLCVGSAGRVPRRYRGRDTVEWMNLMGMFDKTVDSLASPREKFAANPHLSGRDGGRTLNLHRFARDGVVLLGHLRGVCEDVLRLAPDLHDSLVKVDRSEAELVRMIDAHIAEAGLDAPEESLPNLEDGYLAEDVTELDLRSAGITTVIWAMGYAFDFSRVRLPVFDNDGYPLQTRGVTGYPGLYFVGLPWLYKRKSGLLLGVGDDADFIAAAISGEGDLAVDEGGWKG